MIQTKSNLWKTKKRNRILLMITVLFLNAITCLGQHTKKEKIKEQLRSKQKEELTQIALEILKEKQSSIKIDLNDKVTVLGNDQDILVEWKRKITFI